MITVVSQAADFDRRVRKKVTRLPWTLLWLGKEKPDKVCEQRRRVAQELLDTPNGQLHLNAAKTNILFGNEIEHAAATGTLRTNSQLWLYYRSLAAIMQCEIEEIEGVNKLIQNQSKKAPLKQSLLNARVGITKELGLGAKSSAWTKWSGLSGVFNIVAQEAVDHISLADEVLGDANRFSHTSMLGVRSHQFYKEWVDPSIVMSRERVWATPWNTKLYSAIVGASGGKATDVDCTTFFAFVDTFDGGTAWTCPLFHYKGGQAMQLTLKRVAENRMRIDIARPVAFMNTYDLCAEWYAACECEDEIIDVAFGSMRWYSVSDAFYALTANPDHMIASEVLFSMRKGTPS